MKKVLFVTNKLITGGVEMALLSMIQNIPREEYDITIGVCDKGGEFENEFPDYVKIIELPEVNDSIKTLICNSIKDFNLKRIFHIMKNVILCNILKDYNKKCKYRSKIYTDFIGEYDIAICYHKPTDLPVSYIINNVKASKKVLWLHSELKNISEKEKNEYYKLYRQYDNIICVSTTVKRQLIEKLPQLSKKVSVFYNIIDTDSILYKSQIGEKFIKNKDEQIILTVARLSVEKGHSLIIETAKILKNLNKKFKWYIIGEGPIKAELQKKINEEGLNKEVILLGRKENPYGYFKTCDIYVQPSFEEGFGITVAEAKIFQKPIVITDFGTAWEHVENGKNGYIVNMNPEGLSHAIRTLMNNEEIKNIFTNNLKKYKKNNIKENFKELHKLLFKDIAIVSEIKSYGGTEIALFNMLNELVDLDYNVTLYLLYKMDDLLKYINPNVKIVYVKEMFYSGKEFILHALHRKNIFKGISKIYYLMKSRMCSFYYEYRYLSKALDINNIKYSVAFGYFSPASLSDYYVLNCIKANKKALWIHSDMNLFEGIRNKSTLDLYNQVDRIFCVSQQAKNVFDEHFPEYKVKSKVQYNLLNVDQIIKKSLKESVNFDKNYTNILTVGRISSEKGQEDIIPLALKLKEDKIKFRWYLIGNGERYDYLKDLISKNNLNDQVILLGFKKNPYPYIKECDIYVQPSRYEGFCLTISEALIFNKPVLSNNFSGASEQIIQGKNGFICSIKDEIFYQYLKKMILDKNCYESLISKTKSIGLLIPNNLKEVLEFI